MVRQRHLRPARPVSTAPSAPPPQRRPLSAARVDPEATPARTGAGRAGVRRARLGAGRGGTASSGERKVCTSSTGPKISSCRNGSKSPLRDQLEGDTRRGHQAPLYGTQAGEPRCDGHSASIEQVGAPAPPPRSGSEMWRAWQGLRSPSRRRTPTHPRSSLFFGRRFCFARRAPLPPSLPY